MRDLPLSSFKVQLQERNPTGQAKIVLVTFPFFNYEGIIFLLQPEKDMLPLEDKRAMSTRKARQGALLAVRI